jgi:hypothetical protein
MIDMTNNRVPYGLLTDEEKAALHEHEREGGGFLYTTVSDTYWRIACEKSRWYPNYAYRTVPLPKTQDVIAWDRLPEWAEWVARNNSGGVWAYQKEPCMLSIMWDNVSGDFRRIDDFPGIVQIGTCDWKDSKQRRPRG